MDEKRSQLLNRRAQLSPTKRALLEQRLEAGSAPSFGAGFLPGTVREGDGDASDHQIEQTIVEIWRELFGADTVEQDDDFFEMGGNSLLAKRLFFEIEKRLGKSIPPARLVEAPTISQLVGLIQKSNGDIPWSALVPMKRGGGKRPFFCVHDIGGDAAVFLNLVRHIPENLPFYGIQAGIGGESGPLLTSIESMARSYISELRTIQAEGPYHLGGSCFGGIVAFEMAQQLRAMGERVDLLALIDTPCPPYPPAQYLQHNVEHFIQRFRPRLEKCGNLVLRQCKNLLGGNAQVWPVSLRADISQIQNKMDLQRIRILALQNYRPTPYDGKVALFLVSKPRLKSFQDIRLHWSELATGGALVFKFPATHYNMLNEPNVCVLAEKLNTCFQQLEKKDS